MKVQHVQQEGLAIVRIRTSMSIRTDTLVTIRTIVSARLSVMTRVGTAIQCGVCRGTEEMEDETATDVRTIRAADFEEEDGSATGMMAKGAWISARDMCRWKGSKSRLLPCRGTLD